MWDQDLMQMDLLLQNEQVIIVKCILRQPGQEWLSATIYASNFEKKKRGLWDFGLVWKTALREIKGHGGCRNKFIPFKSSGFPKLKIMTWTNKKINRTIACKLDQILVNEWYNLFHNSNVIADKLLLRDHSPLLVSLGYETHHKHRNFKHFNH